MTLTTYKRRYPTLWDEFLNNGWASIEEREISPRARVEDNEKSIALDLELPGVKKEDIKVEVENGVLTISALKKSEKKENDKNTYFNEISYGEFKRSFRLSDEVESENIKAAYENGVLHLELAKKEKALPRKIEIK